MATLASSLSARLWPGRTYTRRIPSGSFTVSSSVPPLPSFSQRDDNVGSVKHFSNTLLHALEEERHFARVEGVSIFLCKRPKSAPPDAHKHWVPTSRCAP